MTGDMNGDLSDRLAIGGLDGRLLLLRAFSGGERQLRVDGHGEVVTTSPVV